MTKDNIMGWASQNLEGRRVPKVSLEREKSLERRTMF